MGFYKSYKSIPSMESIKIKLDEIKEPLFKQTLSTTYVQLLQKFDDDNLGFIKDTAINFCRFQQVKSAILQSVDLLKLEDYEQIYELINKTRYKGLNNDLGSEYVDTFDRRHSLEKEEESIPFPWQVMTNITNGGLKPKKLYLILAPTGVGKSWAFISIAAKAMQEGKKVVYYTLEMTEDEIGERIDSTLCGKTLDHIRDPDNHEKVKKQLEPYRNLLRIKEFLPNKTRLVEIENHYNLLKLFDNFDADVVIIDYGDIIKKESSVNSMYSAYGDVFTMMKTFAKEYNIPVVSGTQGKRESMESEIVLGDQTAHSIGKIEVADFVMSISRTHKDKLSDTARFTVVKNRGGKDGMVYNGEVDFDIGKIEMYDTYTQKSVQQREKMDNNENLMKQRIKERIQLYKNKQENKI